MTLKKRNITDYSSFYCFFTIITKCWNDYNEEIREALKKEISIGTDIFLYNIQKWLVELMANNNKKCNIKLRSTSGNC